MNRIPIVMKVWAGEQSHDFEYVSRSLPSLLNSDLPNGAEVVIFNDRSIDPRMAPFLDRIQKEDPRVRVIHNEVNKGPNKGQADAYAYVEQEYPDAICYMNVDDDVIYSRGWLTRLLDGKREIESLGMKGVFSAFNIPWRKAFAEFQTGTQMYLLKWKQPALNWLLPREVYEKIGPFMDEGIAYDTPYSHWLRLHGYPIFCLKPSCVQNIGIYGAYSIDDKTTAHDFVGEDGRGTGLTGLPQRLRWALTRAVAEFRNGQRGQSIVAPIRWGSEWVYEAKGKDNKPVALFLINPEHAMGWEPHHIEARAQQMIQHQNRSPVAVHEVRYNSRGAAIGVDCLWAVYPTLRECRKYPHLGSGLNPWKLLHVLVRDVLPLHDRGIVHNKIRLENIFVDRANDDMYLAWYGTEPPVQKDLLKDPDRAIATFGGAVDKRAARHVRERFATYYLETVAPEVCEGGQPTPQSDVYAIGAAVLLAHLPKDESALSEMSRRREDWCMGHMTVFEERNSQRLRSILSQCVASNPTDRFKSAKELCHALKNMSV